MKIVSNKHIVPAVTKKPIDNIKIVVSPHNKTISTLNAYNQSAHMKVIPAQIAPQIKNKAVIDKSLVKRTQNPNKPKPPASVTYASGEAPIESIPKIYGIKDIGKGKTLVVIANGPSINEVELERLKDKPGIDTLSINRPDPRVWPTTYWSFYDQSQLVRHEDLYNYYEGITFLSTAIKRDKARSIKFKNFGKKQFSRDLTKGLCIGRTSCYAAMQLALWMDYDKIFFFGVDMHPDGIDGKLHFYGTNPDVDPDIRKKRFNSEAEYFEFAADNMEYQERKKFHFCSSYLSWPFKSRFNYLDHKTAIDVILGSML